MSFPGTEHYREIAQSYVDVPDNINPQMLQHCITALCDHIDHLEQELQNFQTRRGGEVSRVANIVVHVDYAPEEVHKALGSAPPVHSSAVGSKLTNVPYRLIPGPKAFEDDLYVGTFNYLEVGEFIKWFTDLEWGETGSAVLSLNVEGEEYCVVVIRGGEAGIVEVGQVEAAREY